MNSNFYEKVTEGIIPAIIFGMEHILANTGNQMDISLNYFT